MFKKRMNADDAKKLFLNAINPITASEIIPVEECDGRVNSLDIISSVDVPHFRRAAMDGFAVKASDTLGAGGGSPVVLKLGQSIEKGTCVRVHTGSPVPEGGDAVVMLEDTVSRGDDIEIFTQVHPFKNVGEIGEDISKGEVILNEGQKLRPCDIAVLASMGIESISVQRKPYVAIIPTGEELVRRGERELKPGEVYESNGLMASLYIRKWGGIPKLHEIVTDEPEKIREAIISNLDSDMILVSGGTSVGRRDHVPAVVDSLGKLIAHGIGISPGKPTALGIVKDKPVVCMPGYPVAGFVALYFFARPALQKLGQIPKEPERTARAVLVEKIPSRTGFKTFARVKLNNGKAIPVAVSGAGVLSSVSKADGFVIIPPNIEGLAAGEEVDVVLIE